jgi:hypothetical protein
MNPAGSGCEVGHSATAPRILSTRRYRVIPGARRRALAESAEVYGLTEIYVHHSAREFPLSRNLPRSASQH